MPTLDGVGGRSAFAGSRISGSEEVLILASSISPLIALAFGGDFCGDFEALLLPGLEPGVVTGRCISFACEALLVWSRASESECPWVAGLLFDLAFPPATV
jgi:hypothetical protein